MLYNEIKEISKEDMSENEASETKEEKTLFLIAASRKREDTSTLTDCSLFTII